MKKNYTLTLEDTTWMALEEIARKRNFVYHGRLSRGMVIEAFVSAHQKKAARDVEDPPVVASARDEIKQPATRKAWTIAAVLEHWPKADRDAYQRDEWKYRRFMQLALDTINEQSP